MSEVGSEGESDCVSMRPSECVERAEVEETDAQNQTSVDCNSVQMTAECESESTSTNFNTKDSSVGESCVVGCLSSVTAVDELSSSQPLPLSQPAVDISTEIPSLPPDDCNTVSKDLLPETLSLSSDSCSSDVCQSQPSESAAHEQQDTSNDCKKSSSVIDSGHTADRTEDSAETDQPSTVIVISTHQNKAASPSCEPDMDCASADVTNNDPHSFVAVDKVPPSMSDLYMCCSDDDASAAESNVDLPNGKKSESSDSALIERQNESETISGDVPTTKCLVMPRQQTIGNGMAFLHDCIIFTGNGRITRRAALPVLFLLRGQFFDTWHLST